MIIKYTFSGHESFQCKDLWLKKGYDFVVEEKVFTENSSVVYLGVGRNMVSSIRYWLKSFGIINDEGESTEFANAILSDNGYDPFMENFGTLWLLHYKLVTLKVATIYSLFFTEFNKEYKEFTQEQLLKFIKRKCSEVQYQFNENTLKSDISVLLKNYLKPISEKKIVEDSSLLTDLNFLEVSKINQDNRTIKVNYQNIKQLPVDIALFIIIDYFEERKVIDFSELADLFSSMCIHASDLIDLLDSITTFYPSIVFSDDAGIKQIQIISELDKWVVLANYYNKINFLSR